MVILIDISLMMSNAVPPFKGLLANSTASFEKCPSLLLILLGSFLLSVCGNSLHVLNMRPCQIHALQTFSPSLRLAFPFLDHAVQVRSLLFG